jgi:hypothetical protein
MTRAEHHDQPFGHRASETIRLTGTGIPALDDIPSATHWPSLPARRAASEWRSLRDWVETLQARFAHLDHHVIPLCWWRHNEHVEALAALRDHERVSFLPTSPATAPVEWMRALRDIGTLLRAWTAEYPCGASHQEALSRLRQTHTDGWDDHVTADVGSRQQQKRTESDGANS